MQTADSRLLKCISCNHSGIYQANQSDIQANQSGIQSNWSADFHSELQYDQTLVLKTPQ